MEPHLRVAVDIVIFAIRASQLHVLLIRRAIEPFRGRWAIPGGFVLESESLDEAALRELREETGLSNVYLEQLYTFGEPARDPRGRVVTVAYFALVSGEPPPPTAGTDAAEAAWWPMDSLPEVAFDHRRILAYSLERLRNKLEYTTVGFQLMPEKFSLSQLQRVFEAILGRTLDKRNFRRKLALLKVVEPLNEFETGRDHRPAQLYTFAAERFEKLKDRGIYFPF